MSNLERRQADVSPDASAHMKGIKQGNATGNYETHGRAHARRARRPPSARPASTPKGARADRPADAEPVARRRAAAALTRDPRGRRRVPTLAFAVTAAPLEHAAVPTLRFTLRVESPAARRPLGPARRAGADRRAPARATTHAAHDRLFELFGAARRDWGTTLRTLLWTRTTLVVPAFDGPDGGRPARPVHVRPRGRRRRATSTRSRTARCRSSSCSAARVFYARPDGRLQTARLSWDQRGRVPRCRSRVWRETMDRHFPGTRLAAARQGRASTGSRPTSRATRCRRWDAALDALLPGPEETR